MKVMSARAGIRRLPSRTFVERELREDDRERVDEEDEADLPLGHPRLVLREHGEHLEQRVAGGDVEDVQADDSEKHAIAQNLAVPARLARTPRGTARDPGRT